MTLANAIIQVHAHFPGAPQQWETPDGAMPYRVLMAYLAMLPAALALQRLSDVRARLIAEGGEATRHLSEEDADQAYPA